MASRKHISFSVLALAFTCLSCHKVQIDTSSNPTSSGIIMYGNQNGNTLESFGKTADGGYFFSGFTFASAGSNQQGFIQKTDKNGKIEWYREYGGKYKDKFIAAHQTSDGGFIAVGLTSSLALDSPQRNYNTHAYIVKTDANGTLLWQKVYGGQFNDEFYDVAETPDHYFVATGSFEGPSGTAIRQWLYIVKVDQNGDSIWTHKTPNFSISVGTSIAVTSDGGIGVTGYAKKTDTSWINPVFGCLSASGKTINPVLTFDSIVSHDDLLNNDVEPIKNEKIIITQGGFIFICGASPLPSYAYLYNILGNWYEVSIIVGKIDQKGSFAWTHSFTGQGNGLDLSDAMLNPDGSLLISANVPNAAWILNLNSSGIKTSEIFFPGISFSEGCAPVGNSYALGLNLIPSSSNHAYYFGLALADQNGKIK